MLNRKELFHRDLSDENLNQPNHPTRNENQISSGENRFSSSGNSNQSNLDSERNEHSNSGTQNGQRTEIAIGLPVRQADYLGSRIPNRSRLPGDRIQTSHGNRRQSIQNKTVKKIQGKGFTIMKEIDKDKDSNYIKAKAIADYSQHEDINKIGLQKLPAKKDEGVLPGSSCCKRRADISKKRVIQPVNANFSHPEQESEPKNPQISNKCVINRNQRAKLLQQQKERFINKYKENGNIFQERNFSYENMDPFCNDIMAPKDDPLHLDSLTNSKQVNLNKPTLMEENSNKHIPAVEIWNEKRKGFGTVKPSKRKALKLKEKTDTIIQKHKKTDLMETITGDLHNKNPPSIFRSPIVKKDEFFFNNFHQNEHYEEEIDPSQHLPDIIDSDKQEEAKAQFVDTVPYKLPDLGNKYRKMLKESSSDEFDYKPIIQKDFQENNTEFNQKLNAVKEPEISKNKIWNGKEISQSNANRSRSYLNRSKKFNTSNTNKPGLSSTMKKNIRPFKEDLSASPFRLGNINRSNPKRKKKKIISKHNIILSSNFEFTKSICSPERLSHIKP
ncbi:unnamed protein product [Moneuplotes crassus]|uniref:Uncharacterized protein n=1 Tax=Euplotes crassus TaxID=5936 RepID=A0AAD1U2B5_EUPCR|nr:unnamed protein product [Moneuplotes crassus]